MFKLDMVADVFDFHSTDVTNFFLSVAVTVLHVEGQPLLCREHFLTSLTWMPNIVMEHFHVIV